MVVPPLVECIFLGGEPLQITQFPPLQPVCGRGGRPLTPERSGCPWCLPETPERKLCWGEGAFPGWGPSLHHPFLLSGEIAFYRLCQCPMPSLSTCEPFNWRCLGLNLGTFGVQSRRCAAGQRLLPSIRLAIETGHPKMQGSSEACAEGLLSTASYGARPS